MIWKATMIGYKAIHVGRLQNEATGGVNGGKKISVIQKVLIKENLEARNEKE